jgi:hypothetical protein
MLKLLGKLLGKDLSSPPAPDPPGNVSDREILRELHPVASKAAFRKFLVAITANLTAAQSKRLVDIGLAAHADATAPFDVIEAVTQAINDANDAEATLPKLFFCIDHKAKEEIQWQINQLVAARGLVDRWEGKTSTTTESMFRDAAEWLNAHGLELLVIETAGDYYLALIVTSTELKTIVALGKSIKLNCAVASDYLVD